MNNQSNYNVLNEETPNKQSSINEKTSPTNKISFHEYLTRFLYKDIDQSQEKFNNDVTSEENSSDVAGKQREKYAENVYERKNEDVTGNDNDLPSHKFGSCSKAARYNVDDNSARSNMKINENAESLLIRSLAEMFLASILRDSEVFGPESKEMEENEETKENSDTYLFDDESRSEMLADKLEEHLTFAEESDKICSRTEDDYPGEQSGVVPEKEVNLLENESVMHSSKGATQFPVEKKEKGEEFGSPPDTNSLKNCRDSESAGFSDLSPVTDHGKEEEDLNALVRRMIIVELKKHRKKEEIVLKRAHSDTETVIPRKKQNSKSRTGLFSLKGRTFFRDLLELEESLRRNSDNESSESVKVEMNEGMTKAEESINQGENHSKNDVSVVTDCANVSENSTDAMCKTNSSIMLMRKIHVPCLKSTENENEQSIEFETIFGAPKEELKSKCTQTEGAYMVRAVRSCPLRKRRVSLQLQQLHRLTDREPYYSTIVYANKDFSRFIYRKASDNLIYEKGKGSRSPSYIPAPERFRWKYLIPNKVK
nr:uncharacterized protein LOC117611371 isoform X2 [Osmia lignaria]